MEDLTQRLADVNWQLHMIIGQVDSLLQSQRSQPHRQHVTVRDVFRQESDDTLRFMGLVIAIQAKKLNIRPMWTTCKQYGKVRLYEYDVLLRIIRSFYLTE